MQLHKKIEENGRSFYAKATLTFDNELIAMAVAHAADHKGKPWGDGTIWLDGNHRARREKNVITLSGGPNTGYPNVEEFNKWLDHLVEKAQVVEKEVGTLLCIISDHITEIKRCHNAVHTLHEKITFLEAENRSLRQHLEELDRRITYLEAPPEEEIIATHNGNGHRRLIERFKAIWE